MCVRVSVCGEGEKKKETDWQTEERVEDKQTEKRES